MLTAQQALSALAGVLEGFEDSDRSIRNVQTKDILSAYEDAIADAGAKV
jgi:hypothetical protein